MEEDRTKSVKPPKCPRCQGAGFYRGQICTCITGEESEIPQELSDIFGDIFGDIFRDKKTHT